MKHWFDYDMLGNMTKYRAQLASKAKQASKV